VAKSKLRHLAKPLVEAAGLLHGSSEF